jgi:hypothetical protein
MADPLIPAAAPGSPLRALKAEFRRQRPAFLRDLVRDHAEALRIGGFGLREIGDLARGRAPLGYAVHHWTPLAAGGGNDPGNLVLLPLFPNHEEMHASNGDAWPDAGTGASPLGRVRHAGEMSASQGPRAAAQAAAPPPAAVAEAKPVMIAAPPKVAAATKVARATKDVAAAETVLGAAKSSDKAGGVRQATRDVSGARKDLRKAAVAARPKLLFERLR